MTIPQQIITTSVQGNFDYRYGTDFELDTTQAIIQSFDTIDMTNPFAFPVNSNVPYNQD